MVTLGTVFVGSYIGLSGGKKPEDKAKGPPINAGSKDEENFIKYVHRTGCDTDQKLTMRAVSTSRRQMRKRNINTELNPTYLYAPISWTSGFSIGDAQSCIYYLSEDLHVPNSP